MVALMLAFGFLGSRGIWDPDEGRYTNVAINMLHSGDWLNPKRNDDIGHWTKPPLTYWAIAASVGAFGLNPWAARLPNALSFLACVWLAWRIARRIAPGSEHGAALAYATMLFTIGAAQLVTTDYLLAATQALAMWAFVQARFKPGVHPGRWLALMWAGLALGFLTKGPPALLPLLVMLAFDQLMPGKRTHRVLQVSGLLLFAALALPWFIAVILDHPGLFRYFIGDEVVNRVTTNEFGRHGEWYGWLKIYAPTLLLGTLPWTPALWRWARGLSGAIGRWRDPAARSADAPALLLALWVLVPLLVFCFARSRMPLYVLPLFVPLALLVGRQRLAEGRGLPRWTWLALWMAILLGLRLATVWWPTHKNAAAWAQAIDIRVSNQVQKVVFVEDMARYGLRLHLDARVEKISLAPIAAGTQPAFNPTNDEDLATELSEVEREPGAVWICKQDRWPEIQAQIAARGYRAVAMGTPYRGRVIFQVHAAAAR